MTKFQVRKTVHYFNGLHGSLYSSFKVVSKADCVLLFFPRIVPMVFIDVVATYCKNLGLLYYVSIDIDGKLFVGIHD